jgi:hypothetical protein
MKAMFETPSGDWYALPAADRNELERMMRRIARVQKVDWDEFVYAGPIEGEFFMLPESKISGLPDRMCNLRKRRLTWWYLGSLSIVSYAIAAFGLPGVVDASFIIVATFMTMWLRERDLI